MTEVNAAAVQSIRERNSISQAGLARALGVAARTVRSWEAGGPIPDSMQLLLAGVDAALKGGHQPDLWAAAIRERFSGVH